MICIDNKGIKMSKDWNGNKNSVWKTLGASNHTEKERENLDFYATSPIAIDKLLTVEQPYKRVYECACGQGHLAERLHEKGFEIYASDIVDRGYGFVEDFLQMKEDEVSWMKDCGGKIRQVLLIDTAGWDKSERRERSGQRLYSTEAAVDI